MPEDSLAVAESVLPKLSSKLCPTALLISFMASMSYRSIVKYAKNPEAITRQINGAIRKINLGMYLEIEYINIPISSDVYTFPPSEIMQNIKIVIETNALFFGENAK